jgi:enoyl-CoA hydratase/carnithine racemase
MTLPSMDGIDTTLVDHVVTIRIDRPRRRNALTPDHFAHLAELFRAIEHDDEIRAVVVTGTADAFCAGADLGEADLSITGGQIPPYGPSGNVFVPIVESSKPLIGAINGVAAGGGLGLALCCDIRIAREDARFATAFGRIGLTANDAVAWALPRVVGTSRALELIYLGRPVDAAEAERIGLVSSVHPRGSFEQAVAELVDGIRAAPPVAVRLSKRLVLDGLQRGYREHVMAQEYASLANRMMANDDIAEGITAFLEKRPAMFKGSTLVRRWMAY